MMEKLRSVLLLSCSAHLLYGGLVAFLAFHTLESRCETIEDCGRLASDKYPLSRFQTPLWALYGIMCILVDKRLDTALEEANRETDTYHLLAVKWFTKAFSWTPFALVIGSSVAMHARASTVVSFTLASGTPLSAVIDWIAMLLFFDQFLEQLRHLLRQRLLYMIAAAVLISFFSMVPMSYLDPGLVICAMHPAVGRFRYVSEVAHLAAHDPDDEGYEKEHGAGGEVSKEASRGGLVVGAPSVQHRLGTKTTALISILVVAWLEGIVLTLLTSYLHQSWSALPHFWKIGYCVSDFYFLVNTVSSLLAKDLQVRCG